MGQGGLRYPDFFGWTRPVYPLLIALGTLLLKNSTLAAQGISFLAGVTVIPLAYLLIYEIYKSKEIALLGAGIAALSYSAAVWGGFILSDTTGLVFLLLFLWQFFKNLDRPHSFLQLSDITTGILFALAVGARYEYAVLALPLLYLMFTSTKPLERIATYILSACTTFAVFYMALAPFFISSSATQSQFGSLVDSFGSVRVAGLYGFVQHDFILCALFIFGCYHLLREHHKQRELIFSIASLLLLGVAYYQINPEMQRYFVHLLPFLIIPASFGAHQLYTYLNSLRSYARYALASVGLFFLLFQGGVAYVGLHNKDNGLWFTPGYEERAAQEVAAYIPKDSLIVASLPEPYYLALNQLTQSIADAPPYLYLSDELQTQQLAIIDDEGMRRLFPSFHQFLVDHLMHYKVRELTLASTFRYAGEISAPSGGISIYEVPLSVLTQNIASLP
jgi:hypothetical protein